MNNSKFSFVVDMSNPISGHPTENVRTYDYYKRVFLDNVRKLGLSVSGENPPRVRRGADQAGFGNVVTIGTSRTHDAEWIERLSYACEKGYTPVLDLVKDWNLINRKLIEFYKDKYQLRLRSGATVTIHDGFVKVGTELITFEELEKIIVKSFTRR